ncbi:hypothetical protein CHUUTOTORO_01520 [Serratia phage vB_SmaM-ChuuTotoro]|nr:hypothetical protein CHUUTOTORO_01520 [Serratia phage vB_SmaM-ChuuTotoro]
MQQNEMYKHALCREDSSGYGAIFLAGLVYRFDDNGPLIRVYDHHGESANLLPEMWKERFHPLFDIATPTGVCGTVAATASQPIRPDAAAMAKRTKRAVEKKAEDLPDAVWEIIRSVPEHRTSVFISRETLGSKLNHDVLEAGGLFKSLGYDVTVRYDDCNLLDVVGLRLSWAHLVDK